MRNNLLKFLVLLSIICNPSFADQFIFESSQIDILDKGSLIVAQEGTAKSNDQDLVI